MNRIAENWVSHGKYIVYIEETLNFTGESVKKTGKIFAFLQKDYFYFVYVHVDKLYTNLFKSCKHWIYQYKMAEEAW